MVAPGLGNIFQLNIGRLRQPDCFSRFKDGRIEKIFPDHRDIPGIECQVPLIGNPGKGLIRQIIEAANQAQTDTVVTSYAPVGPVASHLQRAKGTLQEAGIDLRQIRRGYDDLAWPYATKGFFGLKKKIPRVLADLGLSA